jgi:hypothetical protein
LLSPTEEQRNEDKKDSRQQVKTIVSAGVLNYNIVNCPITYKRK